jgi:membrane protein
MGLLPAGHLILQTLNFLASFVLITILFAAIYRVVPDRRIEWRDVMVGAVATSLLFTVGKFLIGLYLGSSTVASSYGAVGGLIIALLWVYYSAQIFLFGAEFTKVPIVTAAGHAMQPQLAFRSRQPSGCVGQTSVFSAAIASPENGQNGRDDQ